jgi:hypothetical protein
MDWMVPLEQLVLKEYKEFLVPQEPLVRPD